MDTAGEVRRLDINYLLMTEYVVCKAVILTKPTGRTEWIEFVSPNDPQLHVQARMGTPSLANTLLTNIKVVPSLTVYNKTHAKS